MGEEGRASIQWTGEAIPARQAGRPFAGSTGDSAPAEEDPAPRGRCGVNRRGNRRRRSRQQPEGRGVGAATRRWRRRRRAEGAAEASGRTASPDEKTPRRHRNVEGVAVVAFVDVAWGKVETASLVTSSATEAAEAPATLAPRRGHDTRARRPASAATAMGAFPLEGTVCACAVRSARGSSTGRHRFTCRRSCTRRIEDRNNEKVILCAVLSSS